ARENDIRKNRFPVERMKVLLPESLAVEDVAAQDVNRERQATAGGDLGSQRVANLIREVRGFAGGWLSREHARDVPFIRHIRMRGYLLVRSRENHERFNSGRAGSEKVHLIAGRKPQIEPGSDSRRILLFQRSFQPNGQIPKPTGTALCGEKPPVADFAIGK